MISQGGGVSSDRTPVLADRSRTSSPAGYSSSPSSEDAVFEALGERIQGVFKELRGEGHLTEYHLESALRQIRLSLLEADVALPVVREFTERVKEKAVGGKVMQKLSPAQEVTRIVRDELMALLGGEAATLDLTGRPAVLALVGLQCSGKTTSAAKL